MTRRLDIVTGPAAALCVFGLLTGCGTKVREIHTKAGAAGSVETTLGDSASPAASGAGSSAASGSGASAASVRGKIAAVKDAKLGDIVVDPNGLTLYRFDKDTAKPSKSNCIAACITTWPPVVATFTPKVAGIDDKLIGFVKRPDGTQQITVGGWPVYRFSGDKAPGDTKGQGVGGQWFAVTPTGGKAGAN
jgi:predicted lipoprotein with Yx(FWY)xxD motif